MSYRGRASYNRAPNCASRNTKPYIVMELKYDGTPEEALRQIDDKGYALPWQADGRKVIKVGANFSSELRRLSGWVIE